MIRLAELYDSCFEPSSDGMVYVDSVINLYGFRGFPLFKNSSRMDVDKLIVLGVPASVMNEEMVVLDAEDLSI
jgi:hypothetical protein